MNDAPSAEELLRAVERFLERDVVPRLEGVPKFHARVAANVVAMVAREIETADAHEQGEWRRLGALLESDAPCPPDRGVRRAGLLERNDELARRIRAGLADADPWRAEVLAHLGRTVDDKLAVARPPRER
ncbi:MAG TPA: DUF6285 domain-containing protein [Myxococcota bacterium]|nr:DUF6285 domain-containing protein [Myxococcota bacterium]